MSEERKIRRIKQRVYIHIFNFLRREKMIMGAILHYYLEFAKRSVEFILKKDQQGLEELASEYEFYGCDWDILADIVDEIEKLLKVK